MSLSIRLLCGYKDKALRQEILSRIYETLNNYGLPSYSEPPYLDKVKLPSLSWPYSTNRLLDPLAARCILKPHWRVSSLRENEISVSEKHIQEILYNRNSHVVCLPRSGGYYVPVEIDQVIGPSFPFLGSSIAFSKELETIALCINLELGEYLPDLDYLYDLRKDELEGDIFESEKWRILYLYNMSLASIAWNSAIVFS